MSDSPTVKGVSPQTIAPADLVAVALQFAARTGRPPQTHFEDAHRLLGTAADYLAKNQTPTDSIEVGIAKLYQGNQTWSFREATGTNGPLAGLWKSRQGLDQAIRRLSKKGLLKPHETKRMFSKRRLSGLDISLLVRAVKVDRNGQLDAGDEGRPDAEIVATIPTRSRSRPK